jgi:hypothetical protein
VPPSNEPVTRSPLFRTSVSADAGEIVIAINMMIVKNDLNAFMQSSSLTDGQE